MPNINPFKVSQHCWLVAHTFEIYSDSTYISPALLQHWMRGNENFLRGAVLVSFTIIKRRQQVMENLSKIYSFVPVY